MDIKVNEVFLNDRSPDECDVLVKMLVCLFTNPSVLFYREQNESRFSRREKGEKVCV